MKIPQRTRQSIFSEVPSGGLSVRKRNYALRLKDLDIQLWRDPYHHTLLVLYKDRMANRNYGQLVGAEHVFTIWHCIWWAWPLTWPSWKASWFWFGDGWQLVNEIVSSVTVPWRNGRPARIASDRKIWNGYCSAACNLNLGLNYRY